MESSLDIFEDLDWAPLLDLALREDRAQSDVTTNVCETFLAERISSQETISFKFLSREQGVFCGARLLKYLEQSESWRFESMLEDGDRIHAGSCLAEGQAPWSKLLSQERSVLNILQLLSGVATTTARYSEILDAAYEAWDEEHKQSFPKPRLYHTRKTLPGLRSFQVYAACVGGAALHRLHLADRVMLKDNHKLILESHGLSFEELLNWARTQARYSESSWLIEVDSPMEALRMNAVGAKHLLLDNFSPHSVREILPALNNVESIEVSGGLRLETLGDYVIPGVHRLSIGALTHSAQALDISLEFLLTRPLEVGA